jgi:hypothetical protein
MPTLPNGLDPSVNWDVLAATECIQPCVPTRVPCASLSCSRCRRASRLSLSRAPSWNEI